MWPRTSHTWRRCCCRGPDDGRGGTVHLLCDNHQCLVHVLFRTHRPLSMTFPTPHITVNDLTVGWGARVLMEHVSFRVDRGTVFAILGGSGSGKSTLLRYLIGLERPLAGRIGIDAVGDPFGYEGVPPFGVLFQSGALFSSMTLAENLALPLNAWTRI